MDGLPTKEINSLTVNLQMLAMSTIKELKGKIQCSIVLPPTL